MAVTLNPRPIAVAESLVSKNLRMYDRMMRERPNSSRGCKGGGCEDCPYFHPGWEHRFCLYTKCIYGKNIDVFDMKRLGKKKPLCACMER